MEGEVILVTGGAGFVGQHVVKLLQERGQNIKEIRVFDILPYEDRLGETCLILGRFLSFH